MAMKFMDGMNIDYDKTALQLTEVVDGGLFKDATFTPGGDTKAVPFKVMWEDALAKANYTATGDVAILKFHVADKAAAGCG